ncbi:MAG TPA: DUF983 domain-containing protein [Aggregatilineales bacterium]|jgi:uncharacterized protein (DUF983 family)|nr:DUF983 domain-containing protein [Aggregatilineales bacterium]
MQDLSAGLILRKVWCGFSLRCPNCERGRMFKGHLFKLEDKCAFCDVRFERSQGESIGGVFISLTLAEVLSVGGFFLFDALFKLDYGLQFLIWGTFTILFTIFSYRHMRGMWIGISYLTGGVYRDAPEDNPQALVQDPPDRLTG